MNQRDTLCGARGTPGAYRTAVMKPILVTLALATTSVAFAHPKVAPDLDGRNPSDTVDVIVQFKQQPTEAQHRKVRDRGGVLHRGLDVIRGGHYSMPAGKLEDLAQDPDVAFISPDRQVTGLLDLTA